MLTRLLAPAPLLLVLAGCPVRYVAARINPIAPGGRDATTGGDPAAWADSIGEVVVFFDRHIRQTKDSR